jgi:hypothetical protein
MPSVTAHSLLDRSAWPAASDALLCTLAFPLATSFAHGHSARTLASVRSAAMSPLSHVALHAPFQITPRRIRALTLTPRPRHPSHGSGWIPVAIRMPAQSSTLVLPVKASTTIPSHNPGSGFRSCALSQPCPHLHSLDVPVTPLLAVQ